MQASEVSDMDEGRTTLYIRLKPSFKRRLLRVAKLSDAGTLQGLVEEALTRTVQEEEARLLPVFDAIRSHHDNGPTNGEK